MVDNVILNAGSGGATLRTDDDGTAHWQYVKLVWGADNTRTIVTATAGIPVQPGTGTTWVLGAGTAEIGKLAAGSATIGAVTQSGTWNVTNISGTISLPTGAATSANQSTGNAALAAIQAAVEGTVTVAAAGGTIAVTQSGAWTIAAQQNGSWSVTSTISGGSATQTNPVRTGIDSGIVFDGTTECSVKRFSVVCTADDATVIAAPTGSKKIRVLSMSIIAISTTATTIHLQTKTTNTDCFATTANPLPIAIDADGDDHGGLVLNWNPGGWFEAANADEILAVKMPGGNQAMMFVGNYIEVS